MTEVWKSVEEFKGLYEVSNLGNVKSLDRVDSRGIAHKGRLLTPTKGSGGYYSVNLSKNQKRKTIRIHTLVAKAFIVNDDPDKKTHVNHKDGDKSHNEATNLEWATPKYNNQHAFKTGLNSQSGEDNCGVKISEEDAKFIRRCYIPYDKKYGRKALADRFGISVVQVARIVKKERWKSI